MRPRKCSAIAKAKNGKRRQRAIGRVTSSSVKYCGVDENEVKMI